MSSNPWASSAEPPSTTTVPNYVPLGGLVRALVVTLGLGQVLFLLAIPPHLALLQLDPAYLLEEEAPATHALSELLLLTQGLCLFAAVLLILAAVPLWIRWHVVAARNAALLGRETEIKPVWHAGYWFVPFANLWMPYQALKQLYLASNPARTWISDLDPALSPELDPDPDPALSPEPEPGSETALPSLFGLWWLCHIVSNAMSRFQDRLGDTHADLLLSAKLALISAPLGLVAVVLYLRWVSTISRWQHQLAEEAAAQH